MSDNNLTVYVITWRNELRRPEVFTRLEDAQLFAVGEGVPTDAWEPRDDGIWQAGDWFIDACPVRDTNLLMLALHAYAHPGSWRDPRRWGGPEAGYMVAKRALAGMHGHAVEGEPRDSKADTWTG